MTATLEQPAATGAGPLLERRYYVDLAHPRLTAAVLLRYITCHLTELSPGLLADFEKVQGAPGELAVGHEFHIKILGPWNGTVRVTEVGERYFEFCTLDGHPEAGRIRFSVEERPAGALRFEIHSRARARDGLVAFAYATIGVGKRVQEQTWVMFCERVAEASGGELLGSVHVVTDDRDAPAEPAEHHTR
ncbi:MAG: DUF1990 family protein [Hymenobacteraceae bacterium]|nr:DUF1990 family protein [Hymenobacteraceae bacterium]